MLRHKPYGKSADWWTFGVFCYELNAGEPPFKGHDFATLYKNIANGVYHCPKHFSADLANLCKRLLTVDTTERLGCLKRGTYDVIEHKWFSNCKWNAIYEQRLKAPFIPQVKSQLMWALEKSKKPEQPIYLSSHDKYRKEFESF
jgi:protein kinase A